MAQALKRQVRKVIKEHYGNNLRTYMRKAGDGPKLMEIFVTALAHAIQPGCVPPVNCICEINQFDGHPSPIDIELGKRIRDTRVEHKLSIEELAARMGVHPDYLDELEQGRLTPDGDIYDRVANALGTPGVREQLARDLDEQTEAEGWIRYTIARYFGRSLWTFRPELSYEESVGPFVRALVSLCPAKSSSIKPPYGYEVKMESGEPKVVPSSVESKKVQELFESCSEM